MAGAWQWIKGGFVLGEMRFPDGRVERFEERQQGRVENMIVNRGSLLVSQLIANDGIDGVTYLAVGTGFGAAQGGTKESPAAPLATQTLLENELARKAVSVSYYDTAHVQPSTLWMDIGGGTIVTNKLQFQVTFLEAEAVGDQTEMALFGGPDANLEDGGIILNRKTFSFWQKTNQVQLTWTWVLVF